MGDESESAFVGLFALQAVILQATAGERLVRTPEAETLFENAFWVDALAVLIPPGAGAGGAGAGGARGQCAEVHP